MIKSDPRSDVLPILAWGCLIVVVVIVVAVVVAPLVLLVAASVQGVE